MGYDPEYGGYGRFVPTASEEAEKPDRDLKPGRFGKFCVIYSLAFCSIYTISAMVAHILTGTEPGTLTTCVFAFFGSELLTLGTVRCIKKIKEKGERDAKADSTDQLHAGRDGV